MIERRCFRCDTILYFNSFRDTNARFTRYQDLDYLKKMGKFWQDETVELLCCYCFEMITKWLKRGISLEKLLDKRESLNTIINKKGICGTYRRDDESIKVEVDRV